MDEGRLGALKREVEEQRGWARRIEREESGWATSEVA